MKLKDLFKEQNEPDPGDSEIESAKHYIRNAQQALERAKQKGVDEDQRTVEDIEDVLSTAYNKITSIE